MEHSPKKYITLDDGIDFRTIARIMTAGSYPMNHATARNVLISAMNNFVKELGAELGVSLSDKQVAIISKNQDVHDTLSDVLSTAHEKLCQADEKHRSA